MDNCEVSVILPNYNHGHLIGRAVQAILAQDCEASEIIIVDDGSTDGSIETINELVARSSRIRFFSNSKNEGVVAAKLRALAAATGKYINFAAADDFILPGFFSLAVETLEQFPDAGLFTGDSLLLEGTTGRFLSVRPIVMPSFKQAYIPPSRVRELLETSDNWILTGASVIRADAISACGGLNRELGSFADGFLTRKISLSRGFCYAPRAVTTWSIYPESLSRSTALDPKKAATQREIARAHIQADQIFPNWYASKFDNRWRFATSRVALHQNTINIAALLVLGAKDRIDETVIRAILTFSQGKLARIAVSMWLFIRLRPYHFVDLATTFLFRKLSRSKRIEIKTARQVSH